MRLAWLEQLETNPAEAVSFGAQAAVNLFKAQNELASLAKVLKDHLRDAYARVVGKKVRDVFLNVFIVRL